ncbi:hypothetical protein [Mycobacterium lepromatosis]|uniref:hypothetical protein n=1 Tax=Mycobacterium lepromatosis TaxID=480418 RepID=UPI000678BA99|nr:hypothetical protein [Mycobacterium lepromatosis]
MTLTNGNSTPAVGLGVSWISLADIEQAVYTPLSTGYKHSDTATIYQNEREVGRTIPVYPATNCTW